MKRFEFCGITIEVDEARSAALVERAASDDWCQCDGCTNIRMTRKDAIPETQKKILESVGLDFHYPARSAIAKRVSAEQPGMHRVISVWIAIGRSIDFEKTPVMSMDRFNWMWIESRRESLLEIDGFADMPSQPDGVIYIISSNSVPWLYGEVCSFRSDKVSNQCPDCRSFWRQTGYLTRKSRIPEWMNMAELKEALRDANHRVYVEFCAECGRMEYEVVENKPPFRSENQLLHLSRKHMKQALSPRKPLRKSRRPND